MEEKTVRELLPEFYKDYDLGMEGGKFNPFVRIEFTKNFSLYFPNFTARKKAVLMHDIHHLATGYRSTYSGETEIAAWEIASGCKNYWAAWVLNASGIMTGILFNFPKVLRAYARGRKTKNLYHGIITAEEAMDMKLSEVQKALLLDKYPANTKPDFKDVISFFGFGIVGFLYSILSIIFLPFILVYSIYIVTKLRVSGE